MKRIISKIYKQSDNFIGKKYKTEKDPGTGLLRIIALKDFSDVKKGDRGGLIKSEYNLSQKGDCWVYDNARVYGNAVISDNAKVSESAEVYGNAYVCGNAWVHGAVKVY